MNTTERLQQLIHEKFDVELSKIIPDAPFAEYDLDSLTVAELMFAIEDEFHVSVPDAAVPNLQTLADMAKLLDELTAAKVE
jgi:acyl carrier protein